MNRILLVIALFAVACGPRVSDKDKPKSQTPFNNTTSTTGTNNTTSTTGTNGTTGTNNTTTTTTNNTTSTNNNTTTTTNNTTSTNNNTTTTNNTNNTNNNTVPPAIVQKCATACELLWGNCVDTRCNLTMEVQQVLDDIEAGCKGTGGDSAELCTARYMNEPDYKAIVDEVAADGSCNGELVSRNRCFTFGTDVCTGCPVPDLGGPCTADSQCDGGLLAGWCIAQDTDGSTPGGQCLAGGCSFDASSSEGDIIVGGGTGCGEDGVCYVIDSANSACLPRCNNNNDCDRGVTGPNQSGYSCTAVGSIGDGNGGVEFLGICQSACSDALPCDSGFACSNNQSCEPTCTANADCGQDFNCTGTTGDGEMYCQYAG